MLTGRLAFPGETVSDAVAAILSREPDWLALPAETPESVRRLLRRSLEKDPKRRVHDIADARIELEETLAQPAASGHLMSTDPSAPIATNGARARARVRLAWISATSDRWPRSSRRWLSGASASSTGRRWTPASIVPRSCSPKERKFRRTAARRISARRDALPCRPMAVASRSWRDGMQPGYPCSGCVRWMRLWHRAWLGPRAPPTRSGRPILASSPSWRRAS